MSIQPFRPAAPRIPSLPERVTPVGSSSDEGQSITVDSTGVVRISGVALGDEAAGTEIRLSFDGALVSVALREGMTAVATFRLLEKVMPDGYRLSPLQPVVNPEGDVRGEVVRTPSGRRAEPPAPASPIRRPHSTVDVFSH
ncbi:MAG: hypothetical protein WBV82_30395 [Myxococcaceae bacterium]